ncbi:semaphorin-6C isoform X1 [Tympanuchus pallidicinctus]|uniref:semaphorin-6C isoform X1 n=1 Tax=Tympanuchus pallidicinctus TaxID=109042 RepID=UPI002286DA0D|nr:semaphorin-6C isoform X1 [Tympanuchus pallidicinctus]
MPPRAAAPPPFPLLVLVGPAALALSFPRDLEPRSAVGLSATAVYPRFGGLRGDNGSAELGIGFQRMLRLNGTLLVAARDHLYAFALRGDPRALYPQRSVTWEPRDRAGCAVRGEVQDGCHNHIRVLLPRDARTLFVCGTNAFSPVCRTYQALTLQQEGEELPGQARCPFDARQSIAATFADDRLYSATVADFQASDAVIYRSMRGPALRSIKYSSRWLREPHFVHAMPHGAHVYFFFREMAAELGLPGKVPVSRVGRVCRNDAGGSPRVLERRWTSFLKKRLQCAVPGDVPFHFDVLEAVTAPHTLHGRPAVLAVFGTQRNSIPGSAVCAFYLADVERAFEGPFADPRGAAAPWPPVPEERVPRPRPGCCAGMGSAAAVVTSGDIPDETLSFAKEHPLLHGAVAPAGGRPLFTQTGTRLTQLAVDVGAGPRGNQTVLFVGSEDGRVLKVLTAARRPGDNGQHGDTAGHGDENGDNNGDGGTEAVLLEEIRLYEAGRCRGPRGASRVLGLELHPEGRELIVAFSGCIVRLPLSRCARHGQCRRSCLAARDPYCVWLPPGGCVPFSKDLPDGFEQDVEGSSGLTGTCPGAASAGDRDGDNGDVAHGVRGAVREAAVPVPVLVGCVLGAFVLGALVAGLGAACTRRPAAPKGAPEPPSPHPSPAPRLYPPLPPHDGAPDPHPEPPSPEPPTRTPHGLSAPQPPGPGPPLRAIPEGSGAAGRSLPPPGPVANRVQPGSASLAPWDGAPRRLDVPPDSPPPPRRPLAQRHSLEGAARAAGAARGLIRMHSLGAPGGAPPWAPHAVPLQRSLSVKPPLPPKPPPVP